MKKMKFRQGFVYNDLLIQTGTSLKLFGLPESLVSLILYYRVEWRVDDLQNKWIRSLNWSKAGK